MSVDGLPPLRDVIERHELRAKKSLGQNFLLDLNLTGKIARAAGDLTANDGHRGRARSGRADPCAADERRRAGRRHRARRALPGGTGGDRRPLSGPPRNRRRRRPEDRFRRTLRRAASKDRRQPALQHRHRTAGALADGARLAALLPVVDADVPARGRRSASSPGRQAMPMAGWAFSPVGEPRPGSSSTSRRRPSRRRPRSPRRWCTLCRARLPCPPM